jgi:hypothetical protein
MLLTNNKIYTYANNMLAEFSESADLKLPVKINFYLQKNLQTLKALAIEIEESRLNIIKEYGEINEDGASYFIPSENVEKAQTELNDLFSLEQEVQIYTIDIDKFDDNTVLSMSQMEALMFMIN